MFFSYVYLQPRPLNNYQKSRVTRFQISPNSSLQIKHVALVFSKDIKEDVDVDVDGFLQGVRTLSSFTVQST